MKRILLLTFVFSPNLGGVESHLDDLTNYLAKNRHITTVITYKPLGVKQKIPFRETRKNLTIIRIPWFHHRIFNTLENFPILQILYLVPVIFIFTLFYVAIRARSFDVIQVHGFNMAIVGAIISFAYRIPFVVNTHVSFYFQKSSGYAKILRFFLKRAKNILVLTEEAGRELVKIGVDSDKVKTYHYWVDSKKFYPRNKEKSRRKLGLSNNNFIILFVGRFSPAKGIPLLLNAACNFPKNVETLICGSGQLESLIKERSNNLRSISLIGSVGQTDLPFYYSAADIVIIPSTPVTETYSEGIPRVLIESYSCGTPVIATPTGGTKDSVTSKTGFTIKPTSQSIVTILKPLFAKKQLLANMGKYCVEYAQDNFSENSNGKIIENTLV